MAGFWISGEAFRRRTWTLNGGIIHGGTVSMTGGAQVACVGSGGILDGVTVNGDLDVQSFAQVTVTNGLVLNGTAYVGPPLNGNWAALIFAGTQTLSGNGAVVLGNTCRNAVWVKIGGTTL